jgi:threonine-phosphate decarboxylase
MQFYEHGGQIFNKINLDFSVNINPLGCPVDIKKLDLKTATENYPDINCKILREKLSEKRKISFENIICGNGASDLIMRICGAFKPKKVFTLTPTFSEYERCVKLFGGEITFDKNDKNIDFAFICNPNNPTGQIVSENFVLNFLEKGVTVVLDECFIDFTEVPSMLNLTEKYPNLIVLNAFTKIYAMAGLRLGYAVCSNKKTLENLHNFGATWSVSGIAQTVGIAVLDCENFIQKTQILIKKEREFMSQKISELGLKITPSVTNFMLIESEISMHEKLLQMGILVRKCTNFRGLTDHFFRIGLKKRSENIQLLNAINEVLNG